MTHAHARIADPFVRARLQRYLLSAAAHLGAAIEALAAEDERRFLERTWLLAVTLAVARAALHGPEHADEDEAPESTSDGAP